MCSRCQVRHPSHTEGRGIPLFGPIALVLLLLLTGSPATAEQDLGSLYTSTVRVFSMGRPSCDESRPLCAPVFGHGSGLAFYVQGKSLAEAYVVTNYHVVQHGTVISVEFLKHDSKFPAFLIHADKDKDVALLGIRLTDGFTPRKLALLPLSRLPRVEIPEHDRFITEPERAPLKLGSRIRIVGYAFEATQRAPEIREGIFSRWYEASAPRRILLQTSAEVNRGNSGGPAFDDQGRFLGIVVARNAEGAGIGFIIPAGTVLATIREGLARKAPQRGSEADLVEAHTHLSRSTALFQQAIEWQGKQDRDRFVSNLTQAEEEVDKALSVDGRFAEAMLFKGWLAYFMYHRLDEYRKEAERQQGSKNRLDLLEISKAQDHYFEIMCASTESAAGLNQNLTASQSRSASFVEAVRKDCRKKQAGKLNPIDQGQKSSLLRPR